VEVESGALRWSVALATDGRTTVYPPSATDRYIAAPFTEFRAPTRGGVAVIDAVSGRLLWRRFFPEPSEALLSTNWAGGPVFVGSVVAVSSGDGIVHAFDIESGELRWSIPKVDTGPFAFASPDHDFRPLAATPDLVIAASLTGSIIAYDAASRQERWRYAAAGLGSPAFRTGLVDGALFVPFANGRMVALDATTGQELWRHGTFNSGFIWPAAVLNEFVILSGAGDGLLAARWQK
jgi:outer membrane protein assembly factor BamB